MGSFAKLTIFSFSMVGIFALLFSLVPTAYFLASFDSSIGTEKNVIDYLDLNNVTVYSNTGSDNMTFAYDSLDNSPPDFDVGMGEDNYLQVLWHFPKAPLPAIKLIEAGHARKATFLFWNYWNREDDFHFRSTTTNLEYGRFLYLADLLTEYNTETNGSSFYARCSHVVTSIVFGFNSSTYANFTEAWDAGELALYLSYEIDMNATGLNAWNIVGRLLTFQNPDLGITGTGGTILNYLIAIPLWIGIAIILLYITLALIPFISGLND